MEHFKSLYCNTDENTEELNVPKVTLTKVHKAKVKWKIKNHQEFHNIPNDRIKYGGPEIIMELTKLFQKIVGYGTIPEEWRTSIAIPMFKKGTKQSTRIEGNNATAVHTKIANKNSRLKTETAALFIKWETAL